MERLNDKRNYEMEISALKQVTNMKIIPSKLSDVTKQNIKPLD